METQSQRNRRRLVLIPGPLQGHITPMIQLATILHSKGFSITVAHTQFNFPANPSEQYPNFTFLRFSDGLSDTLISSDNVTDITVTLNTNCGSPLKQLLVDQMMKEEIACIIYDGLMYFSDSVARELQLPSIMFRTTSATNFLSYHSFSRLQSNGYLPLQDSRSWDLVPELDPLRFRDLLIFNLKNTDASLQQLAEALAIRPCLGVICNTVGCLEETSLVKLQKLYQVRFFAVGPLHKIAPDSPSSSFLTEDYSCIAWLNKQATKSVLYVSLGSIASWGEQELTEVAWGLANSRQHFLWVIRPSTINDVSEWAESLPEDVKKAVAVRGHIVKWAPQREVLAHNAVGGFWSHCGWNSTLESLCEGVPIICQPSFGDQRVNARLLSHVWRTGLEWPNIIERDEVESAVRRLMVNPEGKEMGRRAVELKDRIRVAVGDGGSSYDALNGLAGSLLSGAAQP